MLAFWRGIFASLVVACFVRKWQFDWRLLPMAGCFAAMTWTFLSALIYTESSLAIWLQYLAPAWVVILSWLLFHEAPEPSSRIMLWFAFVGVAIILTFQFLTISANSSTWGIVAGSLSGFFYAVVIVMLRRLRAMDAMLLVLVNQSVTALVLLPSTVSLGCLPHGNQWLYLAGFGIFQMGLPYMFFAYGLRKISSQEASGLGMLEPLLVPVWVYIAWRHLPDYQPPNQWTLIGGGFILIGLLIQLAIQFRKHRQLPKGTATWQSERNQVNIQSVMGTDFSPVEKIPHPMKLTEQ